MAIPSVRSGSKGGKFFGKQVHPPIERSFGEYQSNKKTNAFNKSDKEACEWAFLSALLPFRDRALTLTRSRSYN